MKKFSMLIFATSILFGSFSYAEISEEMKAQHKAQKEEMKAKIKEICKNDKAKCRDIKQKKEVLKKQGRAECASAEDKKSCMHEFKMKHKTEMENTTEKKARKLFFTLLCLPQKNKLIDSLTLRRNGFQCCFR